MSNAIDTTYQVNGSRVFTAKIDIVGDASGEETVAELIDVADLTGVPETFKIRAIQWAFEGFSAKLNWEATTDIHAFSLPAGSDGIRFADTGAHLVNPETTGFTGKLLMATTGLASAGSRGTIIIEGQHS
jgi:hypothetical protein